MTGLRVTAPIQQIAHWMTTGEIAPLVVLYVMLTVADRQLQRVLRRLTHREWVHGMPVGYRIGRLLRAYAPSQMLLRYVSGVAVTAPYAEIDPPQNLWGYFSVQTAAIVGVAMEEGVFRGVAYLGAGVIGVDPLWPVVVGTAVWAFLHGIGRGIAILVTTGWFTAALWSVGHWEIAVGLHLVNNLTAITYGYHDYFGLGGSA